MSEVLFGQSYYLRFDPKLWRAMQPYPPLGTLYAAAFLRERGYDVGLFDAVLADSEAEWDEALRRQQPRFAVIYEDNFNYLSKMCLGRMRQAALAMVAAGRARGCTVVVAGSDATDNAGPYLDAGAHYVLVGEGEATLAELLDALAGRRPAAPDTMRGLAFRDAAGRLVQTPRRPPLADLDALPWPAWDLVDVPRYRAIWRCRHGYFSVNMVTTRGCPYGCTWCAKPIWGQAYHVRGPDQVVAELGWLRQEYGAEHVWFADDIMGLDVGWIEAFADAVQREGVRTPFKCLTRADLLLRPGEIPALARAGCRMAWLGAESGSQRILDAMQKGTRVEQIYAAARRLREAGVGVGFFLQFGYPGEGRPEIARTLQMVRDCRPDDIGISVSYPLPGTRFYAQVQAELGAKQHWDDSTDMAMLYAGPFTTPFYQALHAVVHAEFRARRAWEELRPALRRPATLRARHARLLARLARNGMALLAGRLRLAWFGRRPAEPKARTAHA